MHFQNATIQTLSNKIYNVLENGIAQDKNQMVVGHPNQT